ncbi:MAG TPA: phage protein Gp36 family protein [Tahibacter sp.]|uniref:phage protein Gp36 family protein n=1 Tax=Tahibacter sp. TaxID=2056211 RepID=UPI002C2B031A|nr:phage protein Gp36 family protein [Tahibacter sp.]HSX60900.1 phage protein Gp36 family protein [Tahibacter sp.]
MPYVSLVQLAELPGARELGQVASTEHTAVVDPELMDRTLRGGDTSSWSADEVALADQAKRRIESTVAETDALIDGYIARRVTLPLDASAEAVLVPIARAIVRYELHKHILAAERDHPIVRDYANAQARLREIRDGKLTLGTTDPAAAGNPATMGDVQFVADPAVFGRDQLRGFR